MTLLVWHTLTSPQPSSLQVMNRKLPNPKIVSFLQLERRAAFHINYSHHQAHLLTNSTQQYVYQLPRISDSMDGFALPTLSLSFLFLPSNKVPAFFPMMMSQNDHFYAWWAFWQEKRPCLMLLTMLPVTHCYAQYRMCSAKLRNHLKRLVCTAHCMGWVTMWNWNYYTVNELFFWYKPWQS